MPIIIGAYKGSIPYIKAYKGSNLMFETGGKINPLKALIERTIEKVDVELSNEITEIGSNAFMYCENLKSVTIPNSVTSIGASAFQDCISLKSITIPDSVTFIYGGAFLNCSSLESITIPDSVTDIRGAAGSGGFENCISLKHVEISKNLKKLTNSIFKNCSSLESITIPEVVTVIDVSAFEQCSSLTSMTLLPNTPPALGSTTSISTATTTIYVPAGTKSAYESASIWADLLTRSTNPVTFVELS